MICTPATATKSYQSAHRSGADIGLVDLEDSVPPGKKQDARTAAEAYLAPAGERGCVPALRINSPAGAEGLRDLLAVAGYARRPEIVLIPKVESARDLEIVAGALDRGDFAPELYAVIETPRGIRNLASIARAARLGGLVFGAADYAMETGCALQWAPLLFARSAIVNAAGEADVPAIDSPHFDLHDLDGVRREAQSVKALGYCGKAAVHPRQVPVINETFSPSDEEISLARAIVAAADTAGSGITTVGGRMVGPPFFAAAQKLVDQVAVARAGASR